MNSLLTLLTTQLGTGRAASGNLLNSLTGSTLPSGAVEGSSPDNVGVDGMLGAAELGQAPNNISFGQLISELNLNASAAKTTAEGNIASPIAGVQNSTIFTPTLKSDEITQNNPAQIIAQNAIDNIAPAGKLPNNSAVGEQLAAQAEKIAPLLNGELAKSSGAATNEQVAAKTLSASDMLTRLKTAPTPIADTQISAEQNINIRRATNQTLANKGLSEQSISDIVNKIPTDFYNKSLIDSKNILPQQAIKQASEQIIKPEQIVKNAAGIAIAQNPTSINKGDNGQNIAANKLAQIADNINSPAQNLANNGDNLAGDSKSSRQNYTQKSLLSFGSQEVVKTASDSTNIMTAQASRNPQNIVTTTSIDPSTIMVMDNKGAVTTQQVTPQATINTPTTPELPVHDQVKVKIANALKTGDSKIQIQLEPAHLGKIDVSIEILNNGKINITMLAEKADTLDMLQRDGRALERSLQDSGLKTDSGSLNFSLKQGGNNSQQQWAQGNQDESSADNLSGNNIYGEQAEQSNDNYRVYESDRALDIMA